jgi:hypothetical protein
MQTVFNSNDSAVDLNYPCKQVKPSQTKPDVPETSSLLSRSLRSSRNSIRLSTDSIRSTTSINSTDTTHSTHSTSSNATAYSSNSGPLVIPMLEARELKFSQIKPYSQLLDDQNPFLTPQTAQTSHTSDPDWTPLQTWNPSALSWSLSSVNPSQFRYTKPPAWYNRQCCFRFVLVLILTSLLVSFGIAYGLHMSPREFNPSLGARGGAPGESPNAQLQVLGILNNTNTTTHFYFGASIDWKLTDPQHFDGDIGITSHIYTAIFPISKTLTVSGTVNSLGVDHIVDDVYLWTAALIRGTGAIMGIEIIPIVALSLITPSALALLAQKCKDVNDLGVPVLLSFAPEMNGNWFIYGTSH